MRGKTMELFLADGTAEGLTICDLKNWSGHVFKFRREGLARFLSLQESSRTGVYILRGIDLSDGEPRIYIGESDNIGSRLKQHSKNPDKDFWSETYIICSKDTHLTKTHALFVEFMLIEKAAESGRYRLSNSKMSAYDLASKADSAYLRSFVDDALLVLSATGLDIFVPPAATAAKFESAHATPTDPTISVSMADDVPDAGRSFENAPLHVELRDVKTGLRALGVETEGKILVLKGSQVSLGTKGLASHLVKRREELIRDGILAPAAEESRLEFQVDYLFNHASPSAALIAGRSMQGLDDWKDTHSGKTLREIYAERAERASVREAATA
ncbi:protein of unknown function [Bosea sp. OK403]|uniref:GIY-YIG nuclease family protein n=1 Tax=Bosea sp. OK403 TaxID=1855286 RepID=UPI0008DF3EEB|nr:GIY-YIG nuclease family protein [Bosea sp. OK403]SFI85248.1 protein of unknown function [Bosea sp. OK403]